MTNETKENIEVRLSLLRKCLVKNGVSIAVVGDELIFFDTEEFKKTREFHGVKCNINNLVK